ncbi:MAG TPA: hypothetical protein VJR05_01085 [Acidimicrobiia bacterium]|nr:hypothetical protein [Acidimicrobiia bacterium]
MDYDEEIRRLAEEQSGVVARRQLVAAGLNARAINRRRGMLEPVTDKVFRLVGAAPNEQQQLMTAVLHVGSDALISHDTAAAWWGIAGFRPSPIHITIERSHRFTDAWPIVHHATVVPPTERKVLKAVPVVSPALAVYQLAGVHARYPEKVARALDNAWSLRLLDGSSVEDLIVRLGRSGRNGTTLMRALMKVRGEGWVPPASNVESRFDEIMFKAGITSLRRQVDLGGETWTGRVDFKDRELPLVVEILSERYHTALTDQAQDRDRRLRLESLGLVVVEVWDFEIFYTPWIVVLRIKEAMETLRKAA